MKNCEEELQKALQKLVACQAALKEVKKERDILEDALKKIMKDAEKALE